MQRKRGTVSCLVLGRPISKCGLDTDFGGEGKRAFDRSQHFGNITCTLWDEWKRERNICV